MKKLVCLMLVALIGTMASAATMSFSGPATINLGSTAAITIVADVDAISYSIGAIALTKGGATIGSTNPILATSRLDGTQRDGTVNKIWITMAQGTYVAPTKVLTGQALYTFTIDTTGCALGDIITISDWKGTNPFAPASPPTYATKLNAANSALTPLAVTVVPEPMTMALLGLGGLFIRRRK